MTESTVPVPVDLLKKLQSDYSAYPSSTYGPLAAVLALIPTPPKVGDHIDADAAFALPVRSTFVDDDGDTYVVYGTGKVRRVTNYLFNENNQWEEWDATHSGIANIPLFVTFIPSGD